MTLTSSTFGAVTIQYSSGLSVGSGIVITGKELTLTGGGSAAPYNGQLTTTIGTGTWRGKVVVNGTAASTGFTGLVGIDAASGATLVIDGVIKPARPSPSGPKPVSTTSS